MEKGLLGKKADKICKERNISCDYKHKQILEGLKSDIDIELYAHVRFNAPQMFEIRTAIENGVDFKEYADPAFSFKQMREIRRALEEGLSVSEWALPSTDLDVMESLVDGAIASRKIKEYKESLKRLKISIKNRQCELEAAIEAATAIGAESTAKELAI